MRTFSAPLSPLDWRLHYSNRRDLEEPLCLEGVGALADDAIDASAPGACHVVSESRATPIDYSQLSSSHS